MAKTKTQTQVTDTTNVPKQGSAGAKVTVYCKYPLGVKLHVDKMVPSSELVMGGGSREVMRAERIPGMDWVIKGPGTEINKRSAVEIVGGYAVNYGVPKDIWDGWMHSNKDSALVKNELIFARPGDDGRPDHGQAKSNRKTLTGFEPLNPENDPRKPRPSRGNVADVEQEDGDAPGMEA